MPGWVLYGVLYLLFAGVALWLATEALIQHGAPVLFRLLALLGFCGLWAGIVLKTNLLIFGGLAVFVVAQAVVSGYVRKGAHRAWALGGGKGRRGRRDGAPRERSARSDGVFAADPGAYDPEFTQAMEVGVGQALDTGDDQGLAAPAATHGVEFDTQVGIGAPFQSAEAHAAAELAQTPVISPFVDDAYAQEIAEEYARGEAAGFASVNESTAQFARPFTDAAAGPYPDGYPRPGHGQAFPGVDPSPVGLTIPAERGPSVWDTYERRVRLPEARSPAPPQPSGPGFGQPAAAGPRFESPGSGQSGFDPAVSEPPRGAPAATPAPWSRLPDQSQPGQSQPGQPRPDQAGLRQPDGVGASWQRPRPNETLIGQIVSDEDVSFGEQWAEEPPLSFGDRPYPRMPAAGPAEQTPGPAGGWAGPGVGDVPEQDVGEPARHGAGRHGRGKRRGRH